MLALSAKGPRHTHSVRILTTCACFCANNSRNVVDLCMIVSLLFKNQGIQSAVQCCPLAPKCRSAEKGWHMDGGRRRWREIAVVLQRSNKQLPDDATKGSRQKVVMIFGQRTRGSNPRLPSRGHGKTHNFCTKIHNKTTGCLLPDLEYGLLVDPFAPTNHAPHQLLCVVHNNPGKV